MIKWINREFETVEPHSIKNDEVIGLEIDGYNYSLEEEEYDGELLVHTELIKAYELSDLPEKLYFTPCDNYSDSFIAPTLSGQVYREGEALVLDCYLYFEDKEPCHFHLKSFKRKEKKILKKLKKDK